MGFLAFSLFTFLVIFNTIPAFSFTDSQAIHAIMGEARGESYEGKLWVACAIRNRGSLKGVYGARARVTAAPWVWEQARRAWEESKTNRVTDCTHWGGIGLDENWIAKAQASGQFTGFVEIGNQVFFKERKI